MNNLFKRCSFILFAFTLLVVSCSKRESFDSNKFDASVTNSCPKGNVEVVQYIEGTINAIGWALDPEDGTPVANIVVYVDNKIMGKAQLGLDRQDVASFFKNPDWNKSGWEVKSKLALPKGKHILSVVVYDKMEAVTKLTDKEFIVN